MCMRMCNGSKFVLNNASYFVCFVCQSFKYICIYVCVCVCVYNISCMTVKYIYIDI